MKSNFSSWYLLVLVSAFHAGVIAFVVHASSPAPAQPIIEPTIQGMLIAPQKQQITPPQEKPEPVPKPKKPKQRKQQPTAPKAAASEHAIKAEPEPIPEPQPEPLEPVEEAEPTPIIPPSTDAFELKNPAPSYPQLSKKLKEEGTVTLKVLVKADGKVAEVEILKTSGYKRLDDAAKKAFKRWNFSPATQAGVAVDYWYEINFEFSLKKK